MGYQESLIVCKDKANFDKLCAKLNSSKTQLEDYISVCAVGKVKTKLNVTDYFGYHNCTISAGSYFVWVAGDRHPFQSGLKITAKEKKVFNPFTSSWKAIFCDEIDEMREALTGIDLDNSKGIRQENDYICICEISDGDLIEDKYLQAIE